MLASSASDAAVVKAPQKAKTKPQNKVAGPPFNIAVALAKKMASHVHIIEAVRPAESRTSKYGSHIAVIGHAASYRQ